MKTRPTIKIISLALSAIFSITAPSTALAANTSMSCKGYAQGTMFDEIYESTEAEVQFVSSSRFLLTLAAEGETHVDKAICDLSPRATGLLYESQYLCTDEKGDTVTAILHQREKTLSLHSPYFPPNGKMKLKCK